MVCWSALRGLAERALEPAAAQHELAGLRAQHPGVKLDLVWEQEPYAGTLHYEILTAVSRRVPRFYRG